MHVGIKKRPSTTIVVAKTYCSAEKIFCEKKKFSDVTLAINDDIKIEDHRVNFKIDSGTIKAWSDRFATTGYCKFEETCQKNQVTRKCKKLSSCKDKYCNKRHPRICKIFSLDKFCKFGEDCEYLHLQVPKVKREMKSAVMVLNQV